MAKKPNGNPSGIQNGKPMNEQPSITTEDLVRLKVESGLMSFLRIIALWSFALSLAMFQGACHGLGSRYSTHRGPPQPTMFLWAEFALLFSVVCFGGRLLMTNHYLLDANQRRVSCHFRFLWFHSRRLLLEHSDLLAVTIQGRKYFYRGGGWEYRVVVVGKGGRVVPLSKWKREVAEAEPGLEECKTEASQLAGLLDCPYRESPAYCQLVVRAKRGFATVTFAPLRFGCTRLERWTLLILALLLVGGFLLLEWCARYGF